MTNTTLVKERESPDILQVRLGSLFVRERSSGGGFDFVRVTEMHEDGHVRVTSVHEGKPYMKVPVRLQPDGNAEVDQSRLLYVRFHIPGTRDLRQFALGMRLIDQRQAQRGKRLLAWK